MDAEPPVWQLPMHTDKSIADSARGQREVDLWDDPFEPPPVEYSGSAASTPCSNPLPGDVGSGDGTPFQLALGSQSCSFARTHASWMWDGQHRQPCPMVPMCYMVGDRGLHGYPNGVAAALQAPRYMHAGYFSGPLGIMLGETVAGHTKSSETQCTHMRISPCGGTQPVEPMGD